MIVIRIAKPEDAKVIALLARVTFTEAFGHLFRDKNDLLEYFERTFSVAKITEGLNKSNNLFWVATVDDLPVGYAKLKLDSMSSFLSAEKISQLQKIYVLNDFLSMKIGSKLQGTLLEKAKALGYEKIWLSVWEGNEKAINFYKRNDFQTIGMHEFQIGKESFNFINMARNL